MRTYYSVQVGEHFSKADLDEDELMWIGQHQDTDHNDICWGTRESFLEGLVEAEGKAQLLRKTYVNVRITVTNMSVVEVVE